MEETAALVKKIKKALAKSASVQVWVDTREGCSLISMLDLGLGDAIVAKALHVGDVYIVVDGKVWIVFERKRTDDLDNSMAERSPDQKIRLKALAAAGVVPLHNIVYLIEQHSDNKHSKSLAARSRHITKIVSKHRMTTYYTFGLDHSVYVILSFMEDALEGYAGDISSRVAYDDAIELEKLLDNCDEQEFEARIAALEDQKRDNVARKLSLTDYSSCVKIVKNHNDSPDAAYLAFIKSISGISHSKALAIKEEFPTISKLIEAHKLPSFEKRVGNLTSVGDSGKERRLGVIGKKLKLMIK